MSEFQETVFWAGKFVQVRMQRNAKFKNRISVGVGLTVTLIRSGFYAILHCLCRELSFPRGMYYP